MPMRWMRRGRGEAAGEEAGRGMGAAGSGVGADGAAARLREGPEAGGREPGGRGPGAGRVKSGVEPNATPPGMIPIRREGSGRIGRLLRWREQALPGGAPVVHRPCSPRKPRLAAAEQSAIPRFSPGRTRCPPSHASGSSSGVSPSRLFRRHLEGMRARERQQFPPDRKRDSIRPVATKFATPAFCRCRGTSSSKVP